LSDQPDFWSRRRAGVAAEAQADVEAREAEVLGQEQAALEEKTDAEILAKFGLPDPDTLKMGDDFSAFMAKAVPDRIRRRALRTLWRSNPVLANVDMLVDYGEDFTDAATVVENLQTAYQVGKGMLKHVEEMARQAAELDKAPDSAEAEPSVEEEASVLACHEADEDLEPDNPYEPDQIELDGDTDDTVITPSPRRMKFRQQGTAA